MKGFKSLKKSFPQTLVTAISVFLVFFLAAGCEDNEENSLAFDYYPDAYTAPDNSISLDSLESDDDSMLLVVKAINISYGKAHAAFFDILFEPDVFEFEGYDLGNFFEKGGSVNYQAGIDSQDRTRLVVAVSLLGSGSYATESGFIIKLKFRPIRSGDGFFRFENNTLIEQTETGLRSITGIAWFGGYAQVVD